RRVGQYDIAARPLLMRAVLGPVRQLVKQRAGRPRCLRRRRSGRPTPKRSRESCLPGTRRRGDAKSVAVLAPAGLLLPSGFYREQKRNEPRPAATTPTAAYALHQEPQWYSPCFGPSVAMPSADRILFPTRRRWIVVRRFL